MEERVEKNDILKAVVLLMLGFVIGFATHAFISVTGTDDADLMLDDSDTIETVVGDGEGDETKEVIDNTAPITPKVITEPVENNISASYGMSVTNQPAGELVYISEMNLVENAWIAVREDNGGQPGNILGAAWFQAGTTSGIVELLRATEADATYYTVIFVDDGDKQFDYNVDTLVLNDNAPVLIKFLTY